MSYNKNGLSLGGFIVLLMIGSFVVYILAIAASFLISAVAAGGIGIGGFTAIKNYASSIKENLIESNKN